MPLDRGIRKGFHARWDKTVTPHDAAHPIQATCGAIPAVSMVVVVFRAVLLAQLLARLHGRQAGISSQP